MGVASGTTLVVCGTAVPLQSGRFGGLSRHAFVMPGGVLWRRVVAAAAGCTSPSGGGRVVSDRSECPILSDDRTGAPALRPAHHADPGPVRRFHVETGPP